MPLLHYVCGSAVLFLDQIPISCTRSRSSRILNAGKRLGSPRILALYWLHTNAKYQQQELSVAHSLLNFHHNSNHASPASLLQLSWQYASLLATGLRFLKRNFFYIGIPEHLN